MRAAAAPFSRVLVRVPEAYALLGPLEATRPGLLVLDADGRRVDARALGEGDAPAEVAAWLSAAAKAQPRERWLLRVALKAEGGGTLAAFLEAARKVEGIESAEQTNAGVVLKGRPGAIRPAGLAARAAESGAAIREFLSPVPITLTSKGKGDALAATRALAGLAGVWQAAEEEGGAVRAWVMPLLLDPEALAAKVPGWEGDFETRRFAIPGVSQGPPGMRVASRVRETPGILAVTPALASETVTVVGRKGEVDWTAVLTALRSTTPGAAEAK